MSSPFVSLCHQGISDTIVQLFEFHTLVLIAAFAINLTDHVRECPEIARGKRRETQDAGRAGK